MKHIILTFLLASLIITITSTNCLGQINSPVFGDVTTLLELYAKDYNTVSSENRQETIRKDRSEVIGVFKKYLVNPIIIDFDTKEISDTKDSIALLKNSIQISENGIPFIKTSDEFVLRLQALEAQKRKLVSEQKTLYTEYYDKDTLEIDSIKAHLDNSYLEHQLDLFKTKFRNIHLNKADQAANLSIIRSSQKSLPFIGGGLDFQTLMDGLSIFIANRLKAELTNAFITKLQTWINNEDEESILALNILLPKTTDYFKGFSANELNYFSTSVKQHLEEDLADLLSNVSDLHKINSIKNHIDARPELEFAFEAVSFIPELKKIKHPTELFSFLDNSSLIRNWDKADTTVTEFNIGNGIKTTSLFNSMLTINNNGELRYANYAELENYFKNPHFYRLFIGILKQQNLKYYNIKYMLPDTTDRVLDDLMSTLINTFSASDLDSKIDSFTNFSIIFSDVTKHTQDVQEQLTMMRKRSKLDESIGRDTIMQFFNSMIDLFDASVNSVDDFLFTFNSLVGSTIKIELADKCIPYFKISRNTVDLVNNIFNKRYANAIQDGIEIYSYIRKDFDDNYIEFEDELGRKPRWDSIQSNFKYFTEKSSIRVTNKANSKAEELSEYIDKIVGTESIKNSFDSDIQSQLELLQEFINNVKYSNTSDNYIYRPANAKFEKIKNNSKLKILLGREVIDPRILSITNLLNDFAHAKNSDEVAASLERFAMPVGSYSIKRKSKFDVSINSFPGILGSYSFIKSDSNEHSTGISFTAPVGISLAWGLKKGSFGFYFPIIDIGALTHFRFNTENNEKSLPDFTFKNILATGLYAYYGFKNSPLTLYGGWQTGPEFRKVDDSFESGFQNLDTHRISLGLTIDIPLFQLHNKN